MRGWSWTTALLLAGVCSCGHVSSRGLPTVSGERALELAGAAYILGDDDQAVELAEVAAREVKGAARQREAVMIRALAECRREESPPPVSWTSRLTPVDRRALEDVCASTLRRVASTQR